MNAQQKKFTARLNAALAKTGWSQAELARRAGGMRRDAISTYCKGTTIPSEAFQNRIAKALGGTVEELMKGKLPSEEIPRAPKGPIQKRGAGGSTVDIHQGADGNLRIRIDHRVTMEQAQRILSILAE